MDFKLTHYPAPKLGSHERVALEGTVNLPAMPDRDDQDSEAVVINRVDDTIVTRAKPQILVLSLKALGPRRAGVLPQAFNLVADPPPIGAGEVGQLPQRRG